MNLQEHKSRMLAHCLWMAQYDSDYAIWAAGEYERLSGGVLANLQAKVKHEIERRSKDDERR